MKKVFLIGLLTVLIAISCFLPVYSQEPLKQVVNKQEPNLTPYKPQGWSDKIVVTNSPSCSAGNCVASSPLLPTDNLYVNWAIINKGSAATSVTFYIDLYLDGTKIFQWHDDPPLDPNNYTYEINHQIGSLSAGSHTLEIVADSTNVITESNKNDNKYTKKITVKSSPSSSKFSQTDANNLSQTLLQFLSGVMSKVTITPSTSGSRFIQKFMANIQVEQNTPCPEGGIINGVGSLTGSIDDNTGTGQLLLQVDVNAVNCKVQNSPAINGGVSLAGTIPFIGGSLQSFQMDVGGAFTWGNQGININLTFIMDMQTLQASLTGVIGGRQICYNNAGLCVTP